MLQHLRPALASLVLFSALLGLAYPLSVTSIASALFPAAAEGSLIRRGDTIVGSTLIAQAFTQPGYLHPRPSAAGDGYNAAGSSGSNLGPLNETLAKRIAESAAALKGEAAGAAIPADAVTTSASGLDPDISPAYARLQVARIAQARGAQAAVVQSIIDSHTEGRLLGFIGQPRVNVLEVNVALDGRFSPEQASAR